MNNRFKSNSLEEAKAWLKKMFAHGAQWNAGGQKIQLLSYRYFFCRDGKITASFDDFDWQSSTLPEYELKNSEPKWHPNTGVDYINQTILTPDFSNVQVGDKVRDLVYGVGEVIAVDHNSNFPVYVKFSTLYRRSYRINGCFNDIANPTLFYHFSGQFPTAEACVRPKSDAYELHGVTREEIAEIAKAVELIKGWSPNMITWDKHGVCRALLEIREPIDGLWNIDELSNSVRITSFNRYRPYSHWQTPIVLGGE